MKSFFCLVLVSLLSLIPFSLSSAIGGGGIGGAKCGYITYQEFCSAASESTRTKCAAKFGGKPSCTFLNCDGSTIEMGGPLYGCTN